jgi:hypothetical protein
VATGAGVGEIGAGVGETGVGVEESWGDCWAPELGHTRTYNLGLTFWSHAVLRMAGAEFNFSLSLL